jgi:exoribonuclease R
VGEARQRQEIARGGVSLDLPTQRVEADDGGYRIEFETTLPAMGWNAQVSLLAGIVAAERMARAQVGLLRTMPPAPPWVIDKVRRAARALHVDWPDGASYAEVVRNLRSAVPDEAALLALAARGLRGAGYLALPVAPAASAEDGNLPSGHAEEHVPATPATPAKDSDHGHSGPARRQLTPEQAQEHAAVAARYAHVTAPLRRLGDRYATEACLAIEANNTPPDWVTTALPELPAALQRAGGRESGASRAAVDLVEALVLRPLVGRTLEVAVVAVDKDGSVVVCRDPAIETRVLGQQLPLGEELTVRITAADPVERKVELTPTRT